MKRACLQIGLLVFSAVLVSILFFGCNDAGSASAAIAFDSSSVVLYTGDSVALTVTSTDDSYTFSSSNEAVATVSSEGVVTAVGQGTAEITAEITGGISASCTVTVSEVYVAATNGSNNSGYLIKYDGGFGNGMLVDSGLNTAGNAYFTTDIFTSSDGTIYISGMYDSDTTYAADGSDTYIPCYWIKTPSDSSFTRHDLDSTANANYRVYAIYENGGTVYTAGADSSGYACMWKDATINSLGNDTAGASVGLFVDGGTVYLSGRDDDGSGHNLAYYWVVDSTGSVTAGGSLVTDTNTSEAFDVVEKDGTIYLAGFHSDGSYDLATSWKIPSGGSASETTLIEDNSNDSSYASSLTKYIDDVYIGGLTITAWNTSASPPVPSDFYSWYTKDSGSSFINPVGTTLNTGSFDIAVNQNNGEVFLASMHDNAGTFYAYMIKGSNIYPLKDENGTTMYLGTGDGSFDMTLNSISVSIY